MQFGASFSHIHLDSLNLDPLKALKAYKSIDFSWIRLSCYWEEIEKKKNKLTFSSLDPLVDYCKKNNIKIVMSVGMKAPRWPEYYFPTWSGEKTKFDKSESLTFTNNIELGKSLNSFIENCVKRYSSNVDIWQVENEPLNPSGPGNWRIDKDQLNYEIQIVRKLDPNKPILINLWANDLSSSNVYKDALKNADIIGLDLYPRQYQEHINTYTGIQGPKVLFNWKIKNIKKKKALWISELQAEPWEPDGIVTKQDNPISFLPSHFQTNIDLVKKLNPEVILLWGFEFWYLRKVKYNDRRYWDAILKALETI